MTTLFNTFEVERLAGLGLSVDDIALLCEVSQADLLADEATGRLFLSAVRRGRALAAASVADVLMAKAQGGNITAIIWYEKTRRGINETQRIDITHTHKKAATPCTH